VAHSPSAPRSPARHLLAPLAHLGLIALAFAASVAAACASNGQSSPGAGDASSGGSSSGSRGDDGGSCLTCGGGGGSGGGGVIGQSACSASAPCNDFGATAGASCANGECVVIDGSGPAPVPGNPGSLFGSPSPAGGPCLVEPQDGTLFPNGWLRPRISFASPAGGADVFQIRLHSPAEQNDLLVYTTSTYYTLDAATWGRLSQNLVGPEVSVTVAAASTAGGGAALSQTSKFTIASVPALGALIYWTAASYDDTATATSLKGFHIGDEGTTVALTSSQVTQPVYATASNGNTPNMAPTPVFCIGCHTSTPDGNYVAFTAQWPWPNALASVNGSADGGVPVGQPPPYLTAAAAANLDPLIGAQAAGGAWYQPPVVNQIMLGIQTFSPSHYGTGDRVVVSSLGADQNATALTAPNTMTGVVSQLAWIDLEFAGPAPKSGTPAAPCGSNPAPPGACLPAQTAGAGWGILPRNGDPRSAGAPSWSHDLDGKTDIIAYTSTDVGTKDGRLDRGSGDVYLVPYNDRQGGDATPLAGASDPNFNEYYPAWSPDDRLIAFNRVGASYSMYDQPQAEVYVVARSPVTCDGAASAQCRLKANDPVACTGSKSPGVQNTWPKWAPLPAAATGSTAGNRGSDGKLYYWVTFSSTRATACTVTAGTSARSTLCTAQQSTAAQGRAQLYVAGIVVDPASGAITTFPAIYMWNQDAALNNLIPAWDYFPISKGTAPPIQ
jgi:hypothetical protein